MLQNSHNVLFNFPVVSVNITLSSDASNDMVGEDAISVTVTASAAIPDGMTIQEDFNVTLVLTDGTAGKFVERGGREGKGQRREGEGEESNVEGMGGGGREV